MDWGYALVGLLAFLASGMVTLIYAHINHFKRRAERRAEHLQIAALRDSAAALTSTLDVDIVLQRILENVGRVVPHESANIMLLNEDRTELYVVGARGYESRGLAEWIKEVRIPVNVPGYYLDEAMRENRPLFIADTSKDLRWSTIPETQWILSYACAPLRRKGQIVGLLNLDSSEAGFFTQTHADHLQAFADQAAVALENARLYHQLEERAQALERAITERDLLIADLDAYSHTVAHDLKTPLSLLIGYSSMLRDDPGGFSKAELQQHLAMITATCDRMTNIIHELLLLANVRRMVEVPEETLDMGIVVEGARKRLTSLIDKHSATLIVPDEWPQVQGYGPWVEEVWTNYISNAIKYGGTPPTVELGVTANRGRELRFWVRDNGDGLSPEEQAQLFTEFSRLHEMRVEGHGLGLSIVRRIVETLGGQVGVECPTGSGCTFYFTLPAAN